MKERMYIVVYGDSCMSEWRFWSKHRLGSKANLEDLKHDLERNRKHINACHIYNTIDSIRLANKDGF